MHCNHRHFTVEDWLSRFPSFVDDLAPCLPAYTSGYCQSFENVLADSNGPPEERDVLHDLLLQLHFMHNDNPELVEDYEWFHERTCLALSEIEAAWSRSSFPSFDGSPPPQDGPIPLPRLLVPLPLHYLLSQWLLGLRPIPCLGHKYLPLLHLSLTSETVPRISLVPT